MAAQRPPTRFSLENRLGRSVTGQYKARNRTFVDLSGLCVLIDLTYKLFLFVDLP